MICNSTSQVDPEKVYYKLVKPLLGEPNVQQKVKGKWFDLDAPRENDLQPSELEIYDSAAKLTVYFKPGANGFRNVVEFLIDFEFGTRTQVIKLFSSNKELTGMEQTWEYSCEIK